mmetsp:Transcript_47812/g.104084  ORF Transcript_47812/g.104084 Transcript_47812/m.104084 type:complete len:91 (-) Transcript_47812:170-442(-)
MADLQAKFDEAVAFVRSWDEGKKVPNDRKLICYGYFKQATEGDVTTSQPWAVQMVERAKWDAWKKVEGTSKDEAMTKYIEEVEKQKVEFS